MTIKAIIAGNIATMRRTFFWPGLIMIFCFSITSFRSISGPMLTGVMFGGGMGNDPIWSIFYLLGSTLLSMISLLIALPYVAMWIALKTKTPAQAATRTFLLMCILPWIIIGIPKVLIFAPVAAVASHSVGTLLKKFATGGRR